MKLHLPSFTSSPSRWAQVLGRLRPAPPPPATDQPPPRVHVVRLGAAGTAYPATVRAEPGRHAGSRHR